MNALRVVFKRFAAVSSLFFLFSSLVSLTACGDDGSGTGTNTPENEESVAEFETVDDLPACTASKSGALASVADDYYTCAAKKWEKVLEVAKGVCNIRPCDNSTEGKWIYAYSAGTAYQCKSGVWKDAAGKTFDELEFVGCFMDALVKDSVASADDLKNCTENKEGDIFIVGKSMVACYSQKWVEVPGGVISEGDLPDCSGNGYIYVMGKMAVYQCRDGVWYGNGKAVNQTSADVPKSSSSKVVEPESSSSQSGTDKPSSSSDKLSSSSEKLSSSSKDVTDDDTKIRGVCQVSKTTVAKGESVTYSFLGIDGTVVSYSWTFGENATVTTSTNATPAVGYVRSGTYRATLIVNAGRLSESDEVVCPAVTVEADPVTDPLGAECSLTPGYFNVRNVTGISREVSSINVTLVSASGVSIEETLEGTLTSGCHSVTGYGLVCGDEYSWSWVDKSIEIEGALGYSRFALVYAGDTMCTASAVSCGTAASIAHKGESVTWSLQSIESPVPTANTYAWTFMDKDGNVVSTSNRTTPEMTVSEFGIVQATLVLDKGIDTENSLTCFDLNVHPREVSDCACGAPELLSTSEDLAIVDEVSYRWTVTGCTSEGAEPFTYSWEDNFVEQDEKDAEKAIGSFGVKGSYAPVVVVTNQEGEFQEVVCKAGRVIDSNGAE